MLLGKTPAICGCLLFIVSAASDTAAVAAKEKDILPIREFVFSYVALPKAELDAQRVAALTKEYEAANDKKRKAVILEERARQYMRAQKWEHAANDFQIAAGLQPSDTMLWMRGAVLWRQSGNRMKYERHAANMLARFKGATSPYDGERTAKVCWLPTAPLKTREVAERLSDRSVNQRKRAWGQYFVSTRALGHLRYGQYNEALELLAVSDRINASRAQPQVDLDAINRSIEAACLAKLGRSREAAGPLNKAAGALRAALKDADALYTNSFWNDWLIAKMLHDEARASLAAAEKGGPPAVSFETPRATYDSAKKAYSRQDWQALVLCHDADGQTAQAARSLLAAMSDIAINPNLLVKQIDWERLETACANHGLKPPRELFNELAAQGKIDAAKLSDQQNKKIADYARAATAKPAFVSEMYGILERRALGKRVLTLPSFQGRLGDVTVEGDVARADIQFDKEETPVAIKFRRTDGKWFITLK